MVPPTTAVFTLSLHDALPISLAVAPTVRLGASATSFTVTVMVPLVEARSPPSLAVEVTVKVKVPSCAEDGKSTRLNSCHVRTSYADFRLVKQLVPLLRTTPSA